MRRAQSLVFRFLLGLPGVVKSKGLTTRGKEYDKDSLWMTGKLIFSTRAVARASPIVAVKRFLMNVAGSSPNLFIRAQASGHGIPRRT